MGATPTAIPWQRLAKTSPCSFAVQEAALADQLDEMGGEC